MYALSWITREYPEEVKPVAETLGEVILDDSLSDGIRLNATAGLGRIVGEYPNPSIAVEIVDDVATPFDADNPKLRSNAIGLIGDVAIVHTDVVEPYTEEIASRHGDVTEMLGQGTHGQPPGTITDDTEMTLCIAESLVDRRGLDPTDVAERFVDWLDSGPFDIRLMTRDSLSRIRQGTS